MNKEQPPKRLGRPPGSLNKPKKPEHGATHTLITIPKALAAKIASLSAKTGINSDRIAIGALVDGLRKWEGVHETLINYNESIEQLIRESSSGPVRKRTRHAAAPSFTVAASTGDAVALEDTLGLAATDPATGDNGASDAQAGTTYLSPAGDALFGRDPIGASEGTDPHYEQFVHGE